MSDTIRIQVECCGSQSDKPKAANADIAQDAGTWVRGTPVLLPVPGAQWPMRRQGPGARPAHGWVGFPGTVWICSVEKIRTFALVPRFCAFALKSGRGNIFAQAEYPS